MRLLFCGLMAALAATMAACKEDPTAEGSGTPIALHSDFAALNVVIGTTGSFTSPWSRSAAPCRSPPPGRDRRGPSSRACFRGPPA